MTVATGVQPAADQLLAGAFNFRDIGGLPTVAGGAIVTGAVYRSDALDELTADDVRRLSDELNVGLVIDLRATVETGDGRPGWAHDQAGLEFVSLPLSDTWTQWGELTDETRHTLLSRKYMNYVDSAGGNIAQALERLAQLDGNRAAIVHCAVGKDRTGVLIAILLGLLGVPREAIVEDYCATAANLEPIMRRLSASPVYAERIRTNPPEVYLAERFTMEQFLTAMHDRFGGAEGWARRNEVSPETINQLRASLVTPPRGA